MRPLRANTFLADRGARLAGSHACPPPPPGGQVAAAPAVPPPSAGAGDFMTQGSAAVEARAAHNREAAGSTPAPATRSRGGALLPRETAPAEKPKPPAQAGAVNSSCGDVSRPQATASGYRVPEAVTLSEASAFILSLVAAHEGRAPHDILAELIAAAADAIGIHSLLLRDAGQVDLADVPDFALRAANRFRGGGP